MNRRCMILLATALTVLTVTARANAYTMERLWPEQESVSWLVGDGIGFYAGFDGLSSGYLYHEAQWYVNGTLVETDDVYDDTWAKTLFPYYFDTPGTYEIKVRAKYDSWPFKIHVWTSYLVWTVEVLAPPQRLSRQSGQPRDGLRRRHTSIYGACHGSRRGSPVLILVCGWRRRENRLWTARWKFFRHGDAHVRHVRDV